jgi:large subunit ribosomal protein L21
VTVGTPVVTGATVSATVLGEELGPKLVIFKFKQKVKYRRRTGHRQHLVRVRIDAINADGGTKRSKAASAPAEAEAAEKPKAARKPRATKAAAQASAQKAAPAEKPKATRKPRTTKTKPATEE